MGVQGLGWHQWAGVQFLERRPRGSDCSSGLTALFWRSDCPSRGWGSWTASVGDKEEVQWWPSPREVGSLFGEVVEIFRLFLKKQFC